MCHTDASRDVESQLGIKSGEPIEPMHGNRAMATLSWWEARSNHTELGSSCMLSGATGSKPGPKKIRPWWTLGEHHLTHDAF